jgi:hypothetical protein
MDERELGQPPCNWEQSERLLARTFESWRAEFRTILEDPPAGNPSTLREDRTLRSRRNRTRRMWDPLGGGEHSGRLRRHADDIKNLQQTGMNEKMGRRDHVEGDRSSCLPSAVPWAALSAFLIHLLAGK